jgi:hypothetical protein
MTVYSKQSYEDQDDGCILKAVRKQQYIMFSAPHCLPRRRVKSSTWNEVKERGRRRRRKVLLIESSNGSRRQRIKNLRRQGQEI